jgi:hypothetical protein
MELRPHFRDRRVDERFEREGYVLLPGAARAQVRPLRQLHRRLVGRSPGGFHSTLYSPDATHKRAVNAEVVAILGPLLDEWFEGHEPLLTSFISKGRADGGGPMPPHQDWSFVDEHVAASLNVWVPLTDVDDRNGAMSVLPGGHRLPFTIRGTDTPNPFREVEDLARRQMVEVPMRRGDVLVHDHRVLHASPPNRARRARVVAGCAVLPAGAERLHFRQLADGTLERYRVEPTFFTEHTYGSAELPPSAAPAGTVAFVQPTFGADDLPGARRAS